MNNNFIKGRPSGMPLWSLKSINDILEVDGPEYMWIDPIKPEEIDRHVPPPGDFNGKNNPFYGKKHTDEMKKVVSDKIKYLCANRSGFRESRINYGQKNGMYGVRRFGDRNPMFNKSQSEKTRRDISEKAKRRFNDPDYKQKMQEAWNLRVMSEKGKQAIRDKNSRPITLRNPDGNIITIKNAAQYARENNLNPIMLQRVAKGIAKNHKGYTKP